MQFPDRQRAFLVASCCLLAALALNFGLIGLIIALALAVLAYSAARQAGAVWAAISEPATLRLVSAVVCGLTALGGIAYGLGHFAEAIAPVVEEVWVATYIVTALHMYSPASAAGLPASLDVVRSYRYLALMTALTGFLLSGLSPSFVAWVVGFAFVVRAGDGFYGDFAPRDLWSAGPNRLASIGILVAGGALGLTWQQQTVAMPFYDYYTGFVSTWADTFVMGGHTMGIDLIPALLLTALVVWLAATPSAGGNFPWLRWLPYVALALLAVYGVLFSFGGEFGPMLFVIGVLLAGYGVSRRAGVPGTGSSVSG